MESEKTCSRMNGTRRFVILLVLMIGYVLIGAAVFQAIEQSVESQEKHNVSEYKKYFTDRIITANVTLEDMDKFIAEIVEASRMGVFADHNLTLQRETSWTFTESLFFVATMLTTVGYGHISPVDRPGKIFSICYIIVGLPLTLVTFSLIVSRTMRPCGTFLSFLKSKLPGVRRNLYVEILHLIIISLMMFILLFLVPALIFNHMEADWDYFDSLYFCFISLFTIGLGDMVPAMDSTAVKKGIEVYQIFVTLWLYVGLICMMTLIAILCNIKELDITKYFLMESEMRDDEKTTLTREMETDDQRTDSSSEPY